MPVVQQWRKNILRNLCQSGQRRGHRAWMTVVRFCHRQLTQDDKSLQGTAEQDHIEPCRPTDRVFIVSSVQQTTNEADHAAHEWCDQIYSVHRWVVQRCSSLPAACWVDTEALQPVNSYSSRYAIQQNCSLQFSQHLLAELWRRPWCTSAGRNTDWLAG